MLAGILLGIAVAVALAVPLAWKWQLGVRRVVVVIAAFGAFAGALVGLLGAFASVGRVAAAVIVAGAALASGIAVLAWRFYRDPERTPPEDADIVVSPADGEVVYVKVSAGSRIPVSTKGAVEHPLEELTKTPLRHDDAYVIGIAMSFLDVHVNRAPIAGRVSIHRHVPGSFGSLRDPEMVFRNERATTVIERGGLQVATVQIASRLVRQIASFVSEGDHVDAGQRIGVIRLGSQVDVVVPREAVTEILVREGDRVRAGESALARVIEAPAT
jgi:phosphatidylserine decarboxylase